eukprot:TRINITY_DN5045_c0_g1_i3.p1 TRINITY_DN5045_c0_g1~~TRINITY_DN5045_c0_g1_i3.p1  ORF type:complete len:434 (+),score=98.15 TRINITY_DN5045_c0_g1_i3:197-1498(+)
MQRAGHLLCQKQSYLSAHSSRVLSIEPSEVVKPVGGKKTKKKSGTQQPRWRVVLDDTVFFPEGGGQHADTGVLAGLQVVDVQNEQGVPAHYVTGAPEQVSAIQVGDEVECAIDWPRRWGFMQQHSAQHLITAMAQRMYNAPTEAWGLSMSGPSSLDLGIGSLSPEQLQALEDMANTKIREGGDVTPSWMSPQSEEFKQIRSRGIPEGVTGDVRVLTIDGIDSNTCCGTHVQQLQHLQLIKLVRTERLKAGTQTRLWFVAGERAVELFSGSIQRDSVLSTLLGCRPDDLEERVGSLLSGSKAQSQALKRLTAELVTLEGETLSVQAAESPVVLHHAALAADMDRLCSLASVLADKAPEALFVLTAGEGKDGVFVLSGPAELVNQVGKTVAEMLGGRGGGRNGRFQGKGSGMCPAAMEEVRGFLLAHIEENQPRQ